MDGIDTDRMLHRHDLRLLERTAQRVRRADPETARDGPREAFQSQFGRVQKILTFLDAAILGGFAGGFDLRICLHHPVTGCAGNAVPRQRPVIRVLGGRVAGRIGHGGDHGSGKVRVAIAGRFLAVDGELALTHNAVTAETDVLDHPG